MRKFYKLFLWLFLPSVTACSNENTVAPEPVSTVVLQKVLSAVYDDPSGCYTAELGNDQITLHLQFAAQSEGVAMEYPVPQTGSYTTRTPDLAYKVSAQSWWRDASGTYPITEAQIALVAADNSCSLSGSCSAAEGRTLHFRSPADVRFTHTVTNAATLSVAAGDYESTGDKGVYTLRFKNEAVEVAFALYAEASDPSLVTIPERQYTLAAGSVIGTIDPDDCGWQESGRYNPAMSATCHVTCEGGQYTVGGIMITATGGKLRFVYRGQIPFGNDPALFSALGGSWLMSTDRWYVYDKPSKTWVYSDTGNTYTMSMLGMPKYGCMLSTGLFDATFSMFIGVDDEGMFIPCNPATNPVAQVVSGSGTYWLFATLYDPETGYFLSGDTSVPLKLSEDLSQFEAVARTGEVTDPDKGKITVNYTYFGLIGANISTGKVTMFSNWPFVRLPKFARPEITNAPAKFRTPTVLHDLAPVTGFGNGAVTITGDEIIRIIPIR